jgi:hypothetical protein
VVRGSGQPGRPAEPAALRQHPRSHDNPAVSLADYVGRPAGRARQDLLRDRRERRGRAYLHPAIEGLKRSAGSSAAADRAHR